MSDDPDIVGGYRRSAEIRYPAARWGKTFLLVATAGYGAAVSSRLVNAAAPRSPKHWVERKDWTQREKRRRRK